MSVTEVRVPDIAGEVVGFRAWIVEPVYSAIGQSRYWRVRLCSLTNRTTWPPADWLRALCYVGAFGVPHTNCMCGIYAARDPGHLEDQGYHDWGEGEDPVAVGEVGLAGKLIRCERGWRAEKARPIRLWLPFTQWRLARPLAQTYRIPVTLADTLNELKEAC